MAQKTQPKMADDLTTDNLCCAAVQAMQWLDDLTKDVKQRPGAYLYADKNILAQLASAATWLREALEEKRLV